MRFISTLFIILTSMCAFAQSVDDYRTFQSGSWNNTATWERWNGSSWVNPAPSTPNSSVGVITVLNTHIVTVTSSVSADQVTVNSAGQITVNSSVTFTIDNGTGSDLAVSGTVSNAGTITISTSAIIDFNSGCSYIHAQNGGTIPAANFNSGSTCKVTGVTSTMVSIPSACHHFIWDCSGQTVSGNFASASTNNVSGNLTVLNTGTGQINLANGGTRTLNVAGNFTQSGGIFNLSFGTGSPVFSVAGNLLLSGGTFNVALSTGVPVFSVAGNFTNNGATFNSGTGTNLITFNGSSAQTIGGSSSTTFNSVTINNSTSTLSSATVTLGNSITINNVLTLTRGYIISTGSNLLNLGSSATVSGGSASSYVNGPVSKTGTSAFVFPTGSGNGTKWARIGIGAPTSSSTFTAQYFFNAASNTSSMAGTPTPVLDHVSNLEYWQLDRTSGSGNATVTLYWENASQSQINDCSSNTLRVAHWNGSAWENNNNTVTTSGSCTGSSAGSVTTNGNVTSFSPFTFGSTSNTLNPLPVVLTNFSASVKEQMVLLQWTTACELNNDYFTVEKSTDGLSFLPLARIEGHGNSLSVQQYQFTDETVVFFPTYYRLIQVDRNGKATVLGTRFVDLANHQKEIKIYPNPANKLLTVEGEVGEKLEIFNVYGKMVFTMVFTEPVHLLNLDILPGGTYFAKTSTSLIRLYLIR